jgi:hypothetical protein
METIIGFAAGYLAGTRDGKEGLDRLRNSVRGIARSPEARRLVTDAVAMAGAIAGRSSARSAASTASAVADLVMRRITRAGENQRPAA